MTKPLILLEMIKDELKLKSVIMHIVSSTDFLQALFQLYCVWEGEGGGMYL